MTDKLICKKDQLQDISTALSTYEAPTNCTSALKTTERKWNYGKDCLKETMLNLTHNFQPCGPPRMSHYSCQGQAV